MGWRRPQWAKKEFSGRTQCCVSTGVGRPAACLRGRRGRLAWGGRPERAGGQGKGPDTRQAVRAPAPGQWETQVGDIGRAGPGPVGHGGLHRHGDRPPASWWACRSLCPSLPGVFRSCSVNVLGSSCGLRGRRRGGQKVSGRAPARAVGGGSRQQTVKEGRSRPTCNCWLCARLP